MERAESLAREIFGRAGILQKDATQFRFEKPRRFMAKPRNEAKPERR